jgi:hypothetical protein
VNRVAIFTAICGGHDRPKPTRALPGADWHLWTDRPTGATHGWTEHLFRPRYQSPRLSAKWVRLNPELLLPDYDLTVWIDASITVVDPAFASLFEPGFAADGFSLFRHPDRDNIYDECAASEPMGKYAGEPMREQCEHYRAGGLPSGHGLWATGVLIRNNRSERLRAMNLDWMNENVRWSCQDQLSLPWVLWKHRIVPTPIPFSLWTCPLFARDWVGPDR